MVIFLILTITLYSCEENNDTVIDPSISSPVISDPTQTADTVLTNSVSPSINLNVSVSVNTNDGSSINNTACTVYDPDGTIIGQYNMSNGGSGSNPSIYSAAVNINNIQCLLVGVYKMEFVAENNSGLFSNLITSNFRVIDTANVPPVITNTDLPDSVVRPCPTCDSTLLTIAVNAADMNGICDLKDVSFAAYRPNGEIISLAIPMFNNGNGQFIFSSYVTYSTNPNSYGYYKYIFTARDNSNLLSAPAADSIKFVLP